MSNISYITIYNNEGMFFDTNHRSLIKLSPRVSGIEYQDLMAPTRPQSTVFSSDFGDIVDFLMEQLKSALGAEANHRKTFYNPADYHSWRRSVEFSDYDVAWYVNIEYTDDKIVTYVCTNSAPIPAELDQLELMVKEALNIAQN